MYLLCHFQKASWGLENVEFMASLSLRYLRYGFAWSTRGQDLVEKGKYHFTLYSILIRSATVANILQ